jgi:hypothetical protein
MTSQVRIDLTQPFVKRVFVNDVEITNIRSLDVSCTVRDLTTVTLVLIPDTVSIEGAADVVMEGAVSQSVKAKLIARLWTWIKSKLG